MAGGGENLIVLGSLKEIHRHRKFPGKLFATGWPVGHVRRNRGKFVNGGGRGCWSGQHIFPGGVLVETFNGF